jgi:hypothetical protein
MTFKIEKDDNGDEALYMTAIVHDTTVDLDWVHSDDDGESYVQRGLDRFQNFTNPDHSLTPKSAILTMRLYRRGDIFIKGMACSNEFREEAIRLAKDAALNLYDQVFPEIATIANAFVEESIQNVQGLPIENIFARYAAGEGKELAAGELLTNLLEMAKSELVKTGHVVQRIGWRVRDALALFPIGGPPFEKYRYFRAVSEVARRVDADAVVYLSDGYIRGTDGQRTGDEVLQSVWVNPDASSVTAAVAYRRRRHPQVPQDIIEFLPDIFPPDSKITQNLIPAWGVYQLD